jgi:hypothetical protein
MHPFKSAGTKQQTLFVRGEPITNLYEFYKQIEQMSDEEFTRQGRTQEWASWIESTFNDTEFAANMRQMPDRESVLFCTQARLKEYKPRISQKPEVHISTPQKSLTPRTGVFLLEAIRKGYEK